MRSQSRITLSPVVLALSIGGLVGHSPAATAPVDVSEQLRKILDKHKTIPGIVAVAMDGDTVIARGAAGVRKAGDPTPMLFDDQIHLGSCTKAMTAVLIGQLIEQKKLAADSTMAAIFPDLAGGFDPAMKKVTVAQLLQHTSGLPANLPWGSFKNAGDDIRARRTAAVVAAFGKPPGHPPGSAYEYSNTGFVVLGTIVEKIAGKPWEEQIQSSLFDPLGMRSAGFGPPGKVGAVDEPWGHVLRDGRAAPVQSDNAPVMGPAGRVHCSITDWAKFVSRFEDGGQDRLPGVSDQTMNLVLTPGHPGNYGGGWIHAQRAWAGGPVLTHAGSNTMWYCVAWVAPKKHFCTLVAVNIAGDDAAGACDEATSMLIQMNKSP